MAEQHFRGTSDSTVPIAPLWRRCIAFLIDLPFVALAWAVAGLVVGIPIVMLAALFGMSQEWAEPLGRLLAPVIFVLGSVLYFGLLESSPWQATIGKRLLGLRVVTSSMDRPSLRVCCKRAVAKYFSFLPAGAGFFLAVLRENHQAFHDSVSGTLVVRAH